MIITKEDIKKALVISLKDIMRKKEQIKFKLMGY